jgi:anti-anti-sigma regulatory factor
MRELDQFVIDVWHERDGARAYVVVHGDIDLANVGAFRDALELATADCPCITLDLGEVTFLDIQGARTVAELAASGDAKGCAVELAPELSSQARRVFELLRLPLPSSRGEAAPQPAR